MKRTMYCWGTMLHGELKNGMYSRSAGADTPELARTLAKPGGKHYEVDGHALLRVELDGERMVSQTIIEIVPQTELAR